MLLDKKEAQEKKTLIQNIKQLTNIDAHSHTTGASIYIDDVSVPENTLHAHVFYLPIAHADQITLDTSLAATQPGVARIFTWRDIPGANQIGGFVKDEPLLAEDAVHFWGQPVALVVAKTDREARAAAKKIVAQYKPLPVVTDPRIAGQNASYLVPPMSQAQGDVDSQWQHCDAVITGSAESGGQEHLYLEPQGALALPLEGGGVRIISSTQGPTAVQRVAASVLALPMHSIEVEVRRLGGAFGGKEDQATPWAVMAALAALALHRPVKLILPRHDDMRMTGKRHPYAYDFKIGLSQDGLIQAYEVHFWQNGGAATDLSPAVLARSLFHSANTYRIPHLKAVGYCCKTNLAPNTAFRGFGGPQGMFAIESAIRAAAEVLELTPEAIQQKNLLKEGDSFHFGQVAEHCQARRCWAQLEKEFDPGAVADKITAFNKTSVQFKKGMAIQPICFGISFTKTSMNQAGSLVHIYQDGSIAVSTAAIEMGQGVNTKIAQVVSTLLGVSSERVHILSTNTTRVANTSPTAASTGADLNGKATEHACSQLRDRLLSFAAAHLKLPESELSLAADQVRVANLPSDLTWFKLVNLAFEQRVDLSAHGYYATPTLHFDLATGKGKPFAYHVYGTALTEVTLDTLRGRYEVDRVSIVHDFGECLNPSIDLGQLEGALMQGIGWLTLEELLFSPEGKPLTDTLSTYKIPDIYCAPKEVNVSFLKDSPKNPLGLLGSKAIGEPPFMYGLGTFFALRAAMQAAIHVARPGHKLPFIAPLTPERVLMQLYAGAPSSS